METLTMTMLEKQYSPVYWIRVLTDGSATNASKNGGAGIYVQYRNGERQSGAIPTGLYCNYKTEEEAIIRSVHTINNTTPVVFLTNALSA